MKAWGISLATAQDAASRHGLKAVGQDLTPGRGGVARCSFTLSLDTASRREDGTLPYQRISMVARQGTNRRIRRVCWHGHRDVMRTLFEAHPTMRLKSALADYRGLDDFEAKFRDTQGTSNHYNVDLSYGEACTCSN